LKKGLPCITAHCNPAVGKTKDVCEAAGQNGIVTLDFDDIPEGELESAKAKIAAVDYVFATVTSAGGRGIVAFAAYEYEGMPDWDMLRTAMQPDFSYKIDENCKGIYRLRFATYDPDLTIKSSEVCPAVLAEQIVPVPPSSAPIVSCGVVVLDEILGKIDPVDWSLFETVGRDDEPKPPSERDYLLRTCERILETADTERTPLVYHESGIHYYTGTHYKPVNKIQLQNFLIGAAIRCDVPSDIAEFLYFVDKIHKQFLIKAARYSGGVAEPDTPFINLKNGTLFFDKGGHRFEQHNPKRFIRYCLHFDYDPAAIALLWQKHCDRSVPSPEKQLYLAECLALPFYQGKIEKAPIFHGERDTGKSTTFDVYKALIGAENITAESLAMLSRDDTQGGYARARLAGKLVNIASDIGQKMNDEGMTKTLISREAVAARNPYGIGFDMRNYARLMFAMNNMPPQFFTDSALTKRAALVVFDQTILPQDVDTGFAENIIANELPGILNWIIAGLDRLLKKGRLDLPQCCIKDMERLLGEAPSTRRTLMGQKSGFAQAERKKCG
jgi:putative DNA primase/helicase